MPLEKWSCRSSQNSYSVSKLKRKSPGIHPNPAGSDGPPDPSHSLGPAHSPRWLSIPIHPPSHWLQHCATLWFGTCQAPIQLPLPILLPKLDVTLPWELRPRRGNTSLEHLALCCLRLIPGASPGSLPVGAAGTTHTWLHAQPAVPPFQEPGVPGGHADPLAAVCPGGLAPPQLTGT